jgi:hypothetical protein
MASAANAAKVLTIGVNSDLQLKGTDIYCTVVGGQRTTVACFHLPGGPSSSARKGWAILGTDAYTGVTPPGTNTPKKLLPEPSFASSPVFGGTATRVRLTQMSLGDIAAVKGTHMAVFVSTAKGGGDAIGIIYLDGKNEPIVGAITAGISNHFVSLVKVKSRAKTSVVFRHAVY